MKWTFEPKCGRNGKLKSDMRARITVRKTKNYTITLSEKCLQKMGNPTHLCFGISDEGVFTTPENVGTQFLLCHHGSSKRGKSRVVNSVELITDIYKHFNERTDIPQGESKFIDFNLTKVDDNVWQLVKVDNSIKSKWGFR
jgi:hypothetical protein